MEVCAHKQAGELPIRFPYGELILFNGARILIDAEGRPIWMRDSFGRIERLLAWHRIDDERIAVTSWFLDPYSESDRPIYRRYVPMKILRSILSHWGLFPPTNPDHPQYGQYEEIEATKQDLFADKVASLIAQAKQAAKENAPDDETGAS
jgi:hypothetical protein